MELRPLSDGPRCIPTCASVIVLRPSLVSVPETVTVSPFAGADGDIESMVTSTVREPVGAACADGGVRDLQQPHEEGHSSEQRHGPSQPSTTRPFSPLEPCRLGHALARPSSSSVVVGMCVHEW